MIQVTLIAGTYQPTRCGVAHYTDRLRTNLDLLGIPSTVLTTHAAAKTLNAPDVIGAVHDWQVSELGALVRSLHTRPTDILHIQHAAGTYGFERAIFLLPLLLRATGWRKPIVTTVHEYGWWEWRPQWLSASLLEWLKQWGQQHTWWDREDGFLLTCSDAILTTNTDAETVLRERLPAFDDRIHRLAIAPNIEVTPIDQTTARQTLRQTCNWSNETEIIAFFGFLHPVKGLETLLVAFKQIIATKPHVRLLLIGGVESLALVGEQAATYWHKLHTLVTTLGLDGNVHFTGYISAEAASRYLAGADLGVLPFHHGVTLKSGSLLTLLAHGLPVVATRPESPDRELDHCLTFISPRDPTGLAIALVELLNDRAKRHQLSMAGYTVVQNLTWDAIAKTHLQLYQSVLH
ncbi:MAG: glycosyltransferase [Tildeniella nuda ZEHNDER 1965/U140]|jgi:glycosyltransferase involved in cell wall biosynthesis|nr:glycosyltransferase [Tildeniella nuda ZEHNDER 1965/U140]